MLCVCTACAYPHLPCRAKIRARDNTNFVFNSFKNGICTTRSMPLYVSGQYLVNGFPHPFAYPILLQIKRAGKLALPCSGNGNFPLYYFSETAETTPEPTVRPPSRIAKRRPGSIAMGVMSSTSMVTLSPGIHISMPSGSLITPVTSVVRK